MADGLKEPTPDKLEGPAWLQTLQPPQQPQQPTQRASRPEAELEELTLAQAAKRHEGQQAVKEEGPGKKKEEPNVKQWERALENSGP